jgi:hypothetical protein
MIWPLKLFLTSLFFFIAIPLSSNGYHISEWPSKLWVASIVGMIVSGLAWLWFFV